MSLGCIWVALMGNCGYNRVMMYGKIKRVTVAKSKDASRKASPWYVRWYPDGRKGKYIRRSFPTKSLAEQFAKRVFNDLNSGLLNSLGSKPFQEVVNDFIDTKKSRNVQPGTIEQYNYTYTEFLDLCGNPDTGLISIQHIDHYLIKVKDNSPDISSASINSKLRNLSVLFNWAVSRKYMGSNPITKETKTKESVRRPDIWTKEQYEAVESIAEPQWRMLMRLGVNGVARKGSLAKLKVEDVDIENNLVRCWDEKVKDYRPTPLNQKTMTMLIDYINGLPDGTVKLFTSKFHHETWKRMCKNANVPFIKFHSGLRTTMNSWLQAAGVSEGPASRRLGHTTPAMTRKSYSNFEDLDQQREIADKMPI